MASSSSSSSSSNSRPFRFGDLPDHIQLEILSGCPPATIARVTTLSSSLGIGKKGLPHGGDDFWTETPLPLIGRLLPRCPHHASPAMKAAAVSTTTVTTTTPPCACANRTFHQQIVTSYTRAADKYRRAVARIPKYTPCTEQDMLYRYQNLLEYVLANPDSIFQMGDEDVLSDLVDLSLETNRELLSKILSRAGYLGRASVVEKIILSAPEILPDANIDYVMANAIRLRRTGILSFILRHAAASERVSPFYIDRSLRCALQCSDFALAEHILASDRLDHEEMEQAVEAFCLSIQDHIREPTPADAGAIEWLLRHHNLLGDGALRKIWGLLNVAVYYRNYTPYSREFIQRTLRETLPSANRVDAETVRAILCDIVRYDTLLTAAFMGNAFIQTLMHENSWAECLNCALSTRNMANVSYFLERVGSLTTGDVNFRADVIVHALSIAILMNNEPVQLRARTHLNTLLSNHPERATDLLMRAMRTCTDYIPDTREQCRLVEHLVFIANLSPLEFFERECDLLDNQLLHLEAADEELQERLVSMSLFSMLHTMSPTTRATILEGFRTRHPVTQQAILRTLISITPKKDIVEGMHIF